MTDFKAIVESSYDNGMAFWIYTSDYIFGMVPVDANGDRWKEISYTFEEPDNPLFVTERTADLSFQFLIYLISSRRISFFSPIRAAISPTKRLYDPFSGPERMII